MKKEYLIFLGGLIFIFVYFYYFNRPSFDSFKNYFIGKRTKISPDDNLKLNQNSHLNPNEPISEDNKLLSNYADYGIIQSKDETGKPYTLSLNPYGGNVGVGTLYPRTKFEIVSDNEAVGKIGFGDFSRDMWFDGGYDGLFWITNTAPSYGKTSFVNDPDPPGGDDVKHLMTILNNGNIGIGTMNPQKKLQVIGTIGIGDDIYYCNYDPYMLCFSGNSGKKINFLDAFNKYIYVDTNEFVIGNEEVGDWNAITTIRIDTGQDSRFRVINDRGSEVFTVKGNNGNIGIGITNPDPFRLYVNGDMYVSGKIASIDLNSRVINGNYTTGAKEICVKAYDPGGVSGTEKCSFGSTCSTTGPIRYVCLNLGP